MTGAERTVEVICHAREIPHVLQQREQRKEDRHGRKHHRNDPEQHAQNALGEQAVQPCGSMYCLQSVGQRPEQSLQARRKPRGNGIRARDRDPKDHSQQKKHRGISKDASRQNAIQAAVAAGRAVFGGHRLTAQGLRRPHHGSRHRIPQRIARQSRLLQFFGGAPPSSPLREKIRCRGSPPRRRRSSHRPRSA